MKEKRNFVIAIVLIVFLMCMAFHPWRLFMHKDKDAETGASPEDSITCTVSVSCESALPKIAAASPETAKALPQNGQILSGAQVSVSQGDSVLTVLQTACGKENLAVETTGTPAYVKSIDGLSSGTAGQASGWTYTVNGTSPTTSAQEYTVQNGDQIQWTFVTDWVS